MQNKDNSDLFPAFLSFTFINLCLRFRSALFDTLVSQDLSVTKTCTESLSWSNPLLYCWFPPVNSGSRCLCLRTVVTSGHVTGLIRCQQQVSRGSAADQRCAQISNGGPLTIAREYICGNMGLKCAGPSAPPPLDRNLSRT